VRRGGISAVLAVLFILGAFTQTVETANAEACATTPGEDAIIAQLKGRSLARFYRNRTRQRLLRHDLECAIQDIDRAIAIDPENALGYIIRGSIYSTKHQLELAMQDVDQGVKLASQGLVSTDEAGYDYEPDPQIVRQRGIMAWTYFWRGSIHLKRHDPEHALNDFRAFRKAENGACHHEWILADLHHPWRGARRGAWLVHRMRALPSAAWAQLVPTGAQLLPVMRCVIGGGGQYSDIQLAVAARSLSPLQGPDRRRELDCRDPGSGGRCAADLLGASVTSAGASQSPLR
jgi:hypothetical protein